MKSHRLQGYAQVEIQTRCGLVRDNNIIYLTHVRLLADVGVVSRPRRLAGRAVRPGRGRRGRPQADARPRHQHRGQDAEGGQGGQPVAKCSQVDKESV